MNHRGFKIMTSISASKFCFLSCLILLAFSAMPVMAGLDMPGDPSDQAEPNQALDSALVTAATAAGATTAVVESAKQAASSGSKSGGGGLGGLLSGATKGASGLAGGLGKGLGGFTNALNAAGSLNRTLNGMGINTGGLGRSLNQVSAGVQLGSNVASGLQGGALGRLTGNATTAVNRLGQSVRTAGNSFGQAFTNNRTQTSALDRRAPSTSTPGG
jgi:hypothetical protein